jgi:cell wall-associated NlpC family hydrolase
MKVTLHTRLATPTTSRVHRIALLGVAVLVAGGLVTAVTQVVGAQPQPTISAVQAKINNLTAQFNKANQQYDQVAQQLSAARVSLRQADKQLAHDQVRYQAARRQAVQIADSSYEDSAQTSLAGLLTSNDPTLVLAEASIITQVTGTRNQQTQLFLNDAATVNAAQQLQQHTEDGIAQLAAATAHTKNHIATLLRSQKTILDSLTQQQQAAVQTGTISGGGGSTTAVYTGPTATQAEQAVAFAFKQLGCPYSYGSTGPCSVGFDCSGLVMSAWASAGVTIPRDTYSQWAALPHISTSALEPGDLLFYNGLGHVAIYVGGGMFIDAPTPGEVVRELPMDTAWYVGNFDGAARP